MENNIKDVHDETMSPELREELKMHMTIVSLDQLTEEKRDHQIQRSKKILEHYRQLIAQDPELSK